MSGTVVLTTVALGMLFSSAFFFLTAASGAMLAQSAVTGFCPPTMLFKHYNMVRPDGTIAWRGLGKPVIKNDPLASVAPSLKDD